MFYNKNMKKYFYLYICALIAALGGLLSGYDTGVISGAMIYVQKSFNINSYMLGLLVSSVSIGAIFGALINGLIVDKFGRKKVMILTAFIFILGSIFCYYSKDITQLILSRFFTGFAVGVVSFVGPLYLSEISPKNIRGQIVSFHQLAITLGILFSYSTNYLCASLENNWRIMLLLGGIPGIILLIGMIVLSDTPRWLILKGKIEKARKILTKIDKENDIELEIKEIQESFSKDGEKKKYKKRKYIKSFVIGIGIMFVQIATGINAIIYYSPTIFKIAGFNSNKDVLFITIFIGLINFLMTFVAIALSDKVGRKPLLYFGLSGMFLSLIVLSIVFHFDYGFLKYFAILACCTFIVSFSMSLGPVGLLIASEVFPLNIRGFGMSISIISNFLFNFLISALFPVSLESLGGSITFLILASICIVSFFFIHFVVPETKGVSLEALQKKLGLD